MTPPLVTRKAHTVATIQLGTVVNTKATVASGNGTYAERRRLCGAWTHGHCRNQTRHPPGFSFCYLPSLAPFPAP